MYCTHCGKLLSDTAAFCTNCGRPVAVLVPAPAPLLNPVPKHKLSWARIGLTVLLIFFLLIAAASLFSLLMLLKKNSTFSA